jgi:hypothetical protein
VVFGLELLSAERLTHVRQIPLEVQGFGDITRHDSDRIFLALAGRLYIGTPNIIADLIRL